MIVSRETEVALRAYQELLLKWTKKINLISPSTIEDVWDRHILDSLQLYDQIPENAGLAVDMGSGGGLPGIVLAVQDRVLGASRAWILVESDGRKSAFLRTCARELDLNVVVATERLEALTPQKADVITARALSPLERLLEWSYQHGHADTKSIFLKGAKTDSEIEAAKAVWSFDQEENKSNTHEDGRIVSVTNLSRRKDQIQ